MYHRQRFPLWPVWGNVLGQSFFLAVTLISGQVEWSVSSGNHSFEVRSFEEWFVLEVGAGQSFPLGNSPDSHSLGKTHSLQVVISARGMAQLGEWSRFNNQGHAFPWADSFSLGFTVISAEGMFRLGELSRLKNQGQLLFYA
jgi:hypothetical protein